MHYIVIQYIYMCLLYVYKYAYTFIYKCDYIQFLTNPNSLRCWTWLVQVYKFGDPRFGWEMLSFCWDLGVMLPWRLTGDLVLVHLCMSAHMVVLLLSPSLHIIILYIDLSNAHCMRCVFRFIPERWSFLGLGIFRWAICHWASGRILRLYLKWIYWIEFRNWATHSLTPGYIGDIGIKLSRTSPLISSTTMVSTSYKSTRLADTGSNCFYCKGITYAVWLNKWKQNNIRILMKT